MSPRGDGLSWCFVCVFVLIALDVGKCPLASAADDDSSCPALPAYEERQHSMGNSPEPARHSLLQRELRKDAPWRSSADLFERELLQRESHKASSQHSGADLIEDDMYGEIDGEEMMAIQIHHHARAQVRVQSSRDARVKRSGHTIVGKQGMTDEMRSTIISIVVSVNFAACAIFFYVWSFTEKPARDDVVTRDDSQMSGESSPSPSNRRLFRRRVTLTPEDLQRPLQQKWVPEVALGTMSSKGFIVNMFADLCAPGLLPIAYGMASTGFLPAAIMLVVFYLMCLYTMWLIGQTCLLSGKMNFADIWAQEIGPRSAWIPIVVVILVCFGASISYACFYADIFSGVMPALGLPLSRSACLLAFTIFPTTPLCLMKDLSALAPSSFCALIAVIYTTVVMVLRTVDNSYAPVGKFYNALEMPTTPLLFSDHMSQLGLSSLSLVNNLAMAFLAHYNGCKYYRELQNHTPTYLVQVSSVGMGISAVVFGITGLCGFLTFGNYSKGVILNNYSHDDWLINIARIGIGFSIIVSMPLMMSGFREAVLALLKFCAPNKQETFKLIAFQDTLTLILIIIITAVTWLLTDTGLVVGVAGAVCGVSIIYIIPCTLYAATLTNLGGGKHAGKINMAICGAVLGAVLAVLGLLASLGLLR